MTNPPIKNLFIRNDLWKYNHWRISSPYYEEKDISLVPIGGVYSLEGKNFEEIKNINFDRWRKRFIKKYE